jgi:hypothetical protein
MAVCGVRVRVLWGGGRTQSGTDCSGGDGARAAEEAGVVGGGGRRRGRPGGRAGAGSGCGRPAKGRRQSARQSGGRRQFEICQSCSALRSRRPGRGRAVAARASAGGEGGGCWCGSVRAGGCGERLRQASEGPAVVGTEAQLEIVRSRRLGRGRAVATRVSVWEKGGGR